MRSALIFVFSHCVLVFSVFLRNCIVFFFLSLFPSFDCSSTSVLTRVGLCVLVMRRGPIFVFSRCVPEFYLFSVIWRNCNFFFYLFYFSTILRPSSWLVGSGFAMKINIFAFPIVPQYLFSVIWKNITFFYFSLFCDCF